MKIADTNNHNNERYLNFINIHLTTLKGEREGSIRLNRVAGGSRLNQLDLILNHIVSAYQEAENYRIPRSSDSRAEDIWIMAGDFNATEDSEELDLIKRMGFVDGNPDKKILDANRDSSYHNQIGTKWSLKNVKAPAIVVDYIFCGLERISFPIGVINVEKSERPFRPRFNNKDFESDHAVLL